MKSNKKSNINSKVISMEDYTQDVKRSIEKTGYFVSNISRSKTDFGESNYLYVSKKATDEDKIKVRISDHSVTNFDRMFNEIHLHYPAYENEIFGLKRALKELDFRFNRNKYFVAKNGYEDNIVRMEIPEHLLRETDKILLERLSSAKRGAGRKIFSIERINKKPVTNWVDTRDNKVFKTVSGHLEGLEDMHHIDTITKKEALQLGIIGNDGLGFIKPQTAFKNITEQLLAEIKKGNLVWRKGWRSGVVVKGKTYGAQNYETQRPYTGGNAFFITMQNLLNGTDYKFFLTPKQILERGAKIKKGAKPFPVFVFIKNETTKIVKRSGVETEVTTEEKGIIWYYVYPIDLVEGLKEIKRKTHKPDTFNEIIVADADLLIKNMPKAPPIKHGGDKAFYVPSMDYVQLPHKKAFKPQQNYYSVAFHELIHSTGHSKRLDRGNDTRKRDGSKEDKKAYAFEELIAEIGAAYLCGVCEIDYYTINNSAAYLKGWASRLTTEIEEDPNFLKRVVFKAARAATYIIGKTLEKHGIVVKEGKKTNVVEVVEKTPTKKEKKTKQDWVNYKASFYDSNGAYMVKQNASRFPDDADYNKAFDLSKQIIETGRGTNQKEANEWAQQYVFSFYYDPKFTGLLNLLKLNKDEGIKNANEWIEFGYKLPKEILTIISKKAVITPNKNMKASVAKAIEDLTAINPLFKHVGAMGLTMLYSAHKNQNFPDTNEGLKGKIFEKMEEKGLVEYNDRYELTEEGIEIVKKIEARLQTLKAKKSGTDLFPELAGTNKPLIASNAKDIEFTVNKGGYNKGLESAQYKYGTITKSIYGFQVSYGVPKQVFRFSTLKQAIDKIDKYSKEQETNLHGITDAVLIFINAFLATHNKTVTKEELIFILTNFQIAIKSGLIKAKHPLKTIANATQEKLVSVINKLSPKQKIKIQITNKTKIENEIASLHGLGFWNVIAAAVVGKAAEHLTHKHLTKTQANTTTLNGIEGFTRADKSPEIKAVNTFKLNGALGKILGDIQPYKYSIVLTGDPHAGKTEFTMQLANGFAEIGKTVGAFMLEQGGLESKDTKAAIERNISKENLQRVFITGEAANGIATVKSNASKFDVVIVDSWQKLGIPSTKFDELRHECPNTIFIVIFQQNGEGGTRGGVSANYDTPVLLKVHRVDETFVNNYVEVKKNRGNSDTLTLRYLVKAKKIIKN